MDGIAYKLSILVVEGKSWEMQAIVVYGHHTICGGSTILVPTGIVQVINCDN